MSYEPTFEDVRPTIEVGDLVAALDFFRETVGMNVVVVEGEPPTFAIVGDEGAGLGLVQVDDPAIPLGAACYVTMTGLDELIGRFESAGLNLDVPLTVRPWGQRDVVVTVPGSGPKIAFGERFSPRT